MLVVCLCACNGAMFFLMNKWQLDFSSLYASGGMIVEGHRALLFDLAAQAEFQHRVLGMQRVLPMYHLAFESLLFVPLALLPFRAALWLWRILLLAMLALSTRQLAAAFNMARSHALWLAVAFCPVVVSLVQGQDSILLLFLLSSSMVCMRRGQDRWAGFLLALALFKPHLILPIAVLLAWRRGNRFLQGFLGCAAAVVLISLGMTGVQGWMQMLAAWRGDVSYAGRQLSGDATHMPNLRGILCVAGLGAHPALILSGALALLLFALVAWRLRSRRSAEILFPPAIALALLVSTHVYAHDLTVLFIPALALLVANRKIMTAGACAAYCLLPFILAGEVAFFFFPICWVLYLTLRAAGLEPPKAIAA